MHELSLCLGIQRIVERASAGRPVEAVQVRVGQLRQVVPDTLAYCWGLVTQDGPLAGSRLEIEHVPVVVECHDCGVRGTVAEELVLSCAGCGSARTAIRSGDELLVTSIDLVDVADPAHLASGVTSERVRGS